MQKSICKIKEFDKGIRVLSEEQIETILKNCTTEVDFITLYLESLAKRYVEYIFYNQERKSKTVNTVCLTVHTLDNLC